MKEKTVGRYGMLVFVSISLLGTIAYLVLRGGQVILWIPVLYLLSVAAGVYAFYKQNNIVSYVAYYLNLVGFCVFCCTESTQMITVLTAVEDVSLETMFIISGVLYVISALAGLVATICGQKSKTAKVTIEQDRA